MQKLVTMAKRVCCLFVLLLLVLMVYGSFTVPDSIIRVQSEAAPRSIYTVTNMTVRSDSEMKMVRTYDAQVKLFRAIPIKQTLLTVSERIRASPGGALFGLRLYTSGVIVVGIEPVQTGSGAVTPAKEAGLQKGDVILTINGTTIRDYNQFSALLADAQGQPVRLSFQREERQMETDLCAAFSEPYQQYMAGLWVRDSAAGIGTMTFYLPQNGLYAGLGHAVCDIDTGEKLPLFQGDIVEATVSGCKKGIPGQAGELQGSFAGERIGSLLLNENDGVFGRLDQFDTAAGTVPVALPQEVSTGSAEIISTVEENGPKHYAVKIEKVNEKDESGRNLVLRVTDERLLQITGGIVQGMSGSPVLQNGLLVGAVTHVLVNDPKRGYAIFAHTMATHCLSIEQQDKLQLAS